MQGAIRAVADAAKRAGKHWGMPVNSVEGARKIMAMKARFMFHTSDVLILKAGLENMQRQFARWDSHLAACGFATGDSRIFSLGKDSNRE